MWETEDKQSQKVVNVMVEIYTYSVLKEYVEVAQVLKKQ